MQLKLNEKINGMLRETQSSMLYSSVINLEKKFPPQNKLLQEGLKPLWAFPTIAACSSMLCSVLCQISQVEF